MGAALVGSRHRGQCITLYRPRFVGPWNLLLKNPLLNSQSSFLNWIFGKGCRKASGVMYARILESKLDGRAQHLHLETRTVLKFGEMLARQDTSPRIISTTLSLSWSDDARLCPSFSQFAHLHRLMCSL